MLEKEEILLICYFVVVILLLVSFVVVFFYVFQKRKNKFLYEKWEARKKYEQEIVTSRLEIQEQILKNVGWELHDNIGQLLSVAKMQLNMFSRTVEESPKIQVKEIGDILGKTLQEVRSLSKSLNNEVVEYLGVENSIRNELGRFERLNLLKTSLKTSGKVQGINDKDAIIIFRILQEFFSNVIKHAEATELSVSMKYKPDLLHIEVAENGIGFNPQEVQKHSGLINMESRAKLIGAQFDLDSVIGKGTELEIKYPIKQESNG